MRAQVHRDDIRDRRSYFAAIVRKLNDEHVSRRACGRREHENTPSVTAHDANTKGGSLPGAPSRLARSARRSTSSPCSEWLPDSRVLFPDGAGFGLAHRTLVRLCELHGLFQS